MKMIRAVMLSAVVAFTASCADAPVDTQKTQQGALTAVCGGPSVPTIGMASSPTVAGRWIAAWVTRPDVTFHSTFTLYSVGNTGTLWGTISQPPEWSPSPPNYLPWQWEVYGTQNGTSLRLWAPPGEWGADDPWFWDFTDDGSNTLTSYHTSGGWEHNDLPYTLTLTRAPKQLNRPTGVTGTPSFCPGPTNTPVDGLWTVNWQFGGSNPNPNCSDVSCSGGPNNGVCNLACPPGPSTVLFQSFNGAIPYVVGQFQDSAHRGLIFGTQNGTSINFWWWPMIYHNTGADAPWSFNGGLDPITANTFSAPEATGLSGTVVQPGLAFTMTRQ